MAEGDLELPRRHEAEIPPAKLKGYALDPDHDEGKNKARVFASALGIRQADWEYLAEQIMAGIDRSPVIGVRTEGPWGWLYEIRMETDGLNGQTHPVTTVWFSEAGTGSPRLTTTYVVVP